MLCLMTSFHYSIYDQQVIDALSCFSPWNISRLMSTIQAVVFHQLTQLTMKCIHGPTEALDLISKMDGPCFQYKNDSDVLSDWCIERK